MMTPTEVRKLALLSELALTDAEIEKLSGEFEVILGYMAELNTLVGEDVAREKPLLRNVMRDDAEPHEKGAYTDILLAEVPEREGDYIKVKKIL